MKRSGLNQADYLKKLIRKSIIKHLHQFRLMVKQFILLATEKVVLEVEIFIIAQQMKKADGATLKTLDYQSTLLMMKNSHILLQMEKLYTSRQMDKTQLVGLIFLKLFMKMESGLHP